MPQFISPAEAARLVEKGALLVDIREENEHARESIPAARLVPLSRIGSGDHGLKGQDIIFHCASGARTKMNAAALEAAAGRADYKILDGGIMAWKAAGLPTR